MKFLILTLCLSWGSYASSELAASMVPRGRPIDHFGREFIVKTEAGTKVHVEFERDGKFQEATGRNLNHGDELEPGDGLMSLSTVAHNLTLAGRAPRGAWSLEEDKELGWIYDLAGNIMSAKTGKILIKASGSDSLELAKLQE